MMLQKPNNISRLVGYFSKREIYSFVGIGVINTLIDFCVFSLLTFLFGVFSGGAYILFRAISFLVAATNSYFMNKRFTFDDQEKTHASQVVKFIGITVTSFFINLIIGYSIFRWFSGFLHLSPTIIADMSTGLGIVVSMVLNFFGYKFFVFTHPHEKA